jgi:hypothetical protein
MTAVNVDISSDSNPNEDRENIDLFSSESQPKWLFATFG